MALRVLTTSGFVTGPVVSMPSGDFEVRFDCALEDWAGDGSGPVRIFENYGGSAGGFRAGTTATEALYLHVGDGTSLVAAFFFPAIPVADGERIQVRIEFDLDNGSGSNEARIYYRVAGDIQDLDSDSDWTLLDTEDSPSNQITTVGDAGQALQFPTDTTAENEPGDFFRAILYNGFGVGRTKLADVNYDDPSTMELAGDPSSWTDGVDDTETWDVTGTEDTDWEFLGNAARIEVAASGDDGDWDTNASSGQTFDSTASLLQAGDVSFNNFRSIFVRFDGVPIGQGETVEAAVIDFTKSSTIQGAIDFDISAVDADDAAAPTNVSEADGLTLTTASELWEYPNTSAGGIPRIERTVDISSVIQEIVDRPGWVSGNAIVLVLHPRTTSNMTALGSFDGSLDPPALGIVFSATVEKLASDTLDLSASDDLVEIFSELTSADVATLGADDSAMIAELISAADSLTLGVGDLVTALLKEVRAFRVEVNGVEMIAAPRSLDGDLAIGKRSTCRVRLYDETTTVRIRRGQVLTVFDRNGNKVFSGPIVQAKARLPAYGLVEWSVAAIDWYYRAEKKTVNEVYENTTAGDIVRDLVTKYLEEEGVALANAIVEDGPVIDRAVFSRVSLAKALDTLALRTAFWWDIDVDLKLYFVKRESVLAPWDATVDDMIEGTVEYTESSPQYRNRQFVTGGKELTVTQSEDFAGDGKTKTFNVAFPIAKVPTVKVDTVVQTVGIRGLETGKDWYWNAGDRAISQDDAATALSGAQTLTVEYVGEFPIVAITRDPVAIAEAQEAEGFGTGIVDHVEKIEGLRGRAEALRAGDELLNKFARLGKSLVYETEREGLRPGQLQKPTIAEFGVIKREMLIQNVRFRASETALFYAVTAIEGPERETFADLFKRVAEGSRSLPDAINIGEEEIIITVADETDSWSWTEDVTVSVYPCHVPSPTLILDSETILC